MGIIADKIRQAIYGKDVRDSIADGIAEVETLRADYDQQVINAGNSNAEIVAARGGEASLPVKIGKIESSLSDITTQKADKSYVDTKTQANNLTYKESYSTLALLQNAYPTGDTYNHTVLADGLIYTYVNSAWVSTGVQANGTGIADKTITPKKLSFLPVVGIPSKNLFNKDTAIVSYSIIYNTGLLTPSSGWYTSDYISILPSTTYTKSVNNPLAWYDVNKVFISPLTTSGVNTITSPSNAYYCRWSLPNITDVNRAQIELGSATTFYESAINKIDSKSFNPKTILKEHLNFGVVEGLPSKNLFNKLKVTSGYYIDYTTGKLAVNSAISASDYIPVSPNTTYVKTNTTQFAYYDINGNFISGANAISSFTTPSNAYYVRLSIENYLLDRFQIEFGNVITSYVPYGNSVGFVPSKNLFNRNTALVDTYIDEKGLPQTASGWYASDWIPISPNTEYFKNVGNSLAWYTSAKVFISPLTTSGVYAITSPSNAYYCRFSIASGIDINSVQLEKGTSQSNFEKYEVQLLEKDKIRFGYKNCIVAAKQGGDFTTITDAVNSIVDDVNNPTTILIMPGVYIESVSIWKKHINLIGLNRETCIIKDITGDYYNAPIEMSGKNNVENLTVIATHTTTVDPLFSSYAIHHDFSGEGKSHIRNCTLYTDNSSAFGCGSQNNQQIILENCELRSTTREALLFHNYQLTGATNQKIIVKNCYLYSDTGKCLEIVDANHSASGGLDNIDTTVTFINNTLFDGVGVGNYLVNKTTPQAGCFAGYMKLTLDSHGNNAPILNA